MNGNPWKAAAAALAFFLLCTGAVWGMIDAHADHPHKDAVSRPELVLLLQRLDRIESKLDQALQD